MAITPSKAAIEAAGLEYIEPTEIVKDTGPRALNLLAQAVVDIQAKPATIDGDIPIFATLAEAEAYEAANPGRIALTIESTEPDTTPPTLGTLTITPEGTKATAVISGAKDDRGSVEYSFKLGSGEWSEWQSESRHTFTGLSLSTDYTATHRVRDRANNIVEGYSQSFTTLAEDLWGTLWVDSFANNPDGSIGGAALDSPSSASWETSVTDMKGTALEIPSVTGGAITAPGWGLVKLPSAPKRVRLSYTHKGGNAQRSPLPVLGGIDTQNFDYVRPSSSPSTPTKWFHQQAGVTDYTQYESNLLKADGTTYKQPGFSGWSEVSHHYEMDFVTHELVVFENTTEKIRTTVPADRIYGGDVFGFSTWNLDFAGGGYIASWSIRWE